MLQSSYNANAFASTFAFFKTLKPLLKKAKELASQRTTNSKDSANLAQTTFLDREARTGNSGFAKKRVQCLIEHSTSHQLLYYVDSFVLSCQQAGKPARTQGLETLPPSFASNKLLTTG